MRKRVARPFGLLLTPLVALALSSCAGGAADEAASGDAEQANQGSYVSVTDQQGSVEGFVGASEDAEITLCESKNNQSLAEGTVTNPTDANQSYRLYIAFNEGRDTQGLVQVDIESVEPGETLTWEAQAPVTTKDIQCSARVERFEP